MARRRLLFTFAAATIFFFLFVDIRKLPRGLKLPFAWRIPHFEEGFPTANLTNFNFPFPKERKILRSQDSFLNSLDLLTEKPRDSEVVDLRGQTMDKNMVIKYLDKPFKEEVLSAKGNHEVWETYGPTLGSIGDYFRYLMATQIDCRKVLRMGGEFDCKGEFGDINNRDGHKYICMEAPLLLGTRRSGSPQECLVMSFGTLFSTSFDQAMADLPCEVHMYDLWDYTPFWASEVEHVHFHMEGLAGAPRIETYLNLNRSASLKPLHKHIEKSHLSTRLIHVLKVDIEGYEWETFRDIAQDPIFDAVGQISLEVHSQGLVMSSSKHVNDKWPEDQRLRELQDRYNVLRAIESRGFRRVLYWENKRTRNLYHDPDGSIFATAGELLYINTNWFNGSFMKQLAERGYEFDSG